MLRRGDYVLCNFPFRESRGPRPSPHIVLCAATGRAGNIRFAIVFYTTSKSISRVRGDRVSIYSSARRGPSNLARRLLSCRCEPDRPLPITPDYFPELGGKPISAMARDADFVSKVEERMMELIQAGFEITKVDAV